jgi:hypothetical protein
MIEPEKPSSPPQSMDEYLRSKVAAQFRQVVGAVEQRVAAAQRELEDLRAASGTMAWEVSGAQPLVRYLNVANGDMTVADQPMSAPFMTISQSAEDWGRFTGGMASLFGPDSRRPMGRARIDRVRAVKGALRFVLTGLPDGGSWTCTVYFGSGPRPAEPQTTITMPADALSKIQAGQLDPQMAFMQGQIKMAGDMGLAMQLGMALFM